MTRNTQDLLCDLIEHINNVAYTPTEEEKEILSGEATDREIVQFAMKVFGPNGPDYLYRLYDHFCPDV